MIARKKINSQNRRFVTELAKELFMRYGFLRITMDDIAGKAGISKKTLYQYFENKDQLVNTCIGEEINQVYVDLAIILSSDIGYSEKWSHSISLITRRSHEADHTFYRDILSRPKQIQYFTKKKNQVIDLVLNNFVYHKGREQLAVMFRSFLALLLISASGQLEGIDRTAFIETIASLYGQAYDHLEKSSVVETDPGVLKFVKVK